MMMRYERAAQCPDALARAFGACGFRVTCASSSAEFERRIRTSWCEIIVEATVLRLGADLIVTYEAAPAKRWVVLDFGASAAALHVAVSPVDSQLGFPRVILCCRRCAFPHLRYEPGKKCSECGCCETCKYAIRPRPMDALIMAIAAACCGGFAFFLGALALKLLSGQWAFASIETSLWLAVRATPYYLLASCCAAILSSLASSRIARLRLQRRPAVL